MDVAVANELGDVFEVVFGLTPKAGKTYNRLTHRGLLTVSDERIHVAGEIRPERTGGAVAAGGLIGGLVAGAVVGTKPLNLTIDPGRAIGIYDAKRMECCLELPDGKWLVLAPKPRTFRKASPDAFQAILDALKASYGERIDAAKLGGLATREKALLWVFAGCMIFAAAIMLLLYLADKAKR